MNEDIPDNKTEVTDFLRVARAARFAMVCIVLGFSCITVRMTSNIHNFETIFTDMLGDGAKLPALPLFVLHTQTLLNVLARGIPVVCIAALFMRDIARSFYLLGTLAIASIIMWFVISTAVSLPLNEIISRMSGVPTP